jgi:hypothetical protein
MLPGFVILPERVKTDLSLQEKIRAENKAIKLNTV